MKTAPIIAQVNQTVAHQLSLLPAGHVLSDGTRIRPEASAAAGFACNTVFAAGNIVLGVYFASAWLITMGAYYALLSIMRFVAVRMLQKRTGDDSPRKKARQVRTIKLDGILLMVLTLVLSGTVTLTISNGKTLPENEILAIAIATYTFIKLSLAIAGTIGARHTHIALLRALKSIALVDALVSILFLQTILMDTFGGDDTFRLIMTAATGAVICASSFIIGLLLFRSNKASNKPRLLSKPIL